VKMKEIPQTENFILERPHLRYIKKTLSLLESDIGPDGEKINWKNLYEKVGSWDSALELSDQIREAVREYLLSKFPKIKDKIPSIADLPDPQMLNALSNGWFEELGEEVGGTRREVLLAVLAHITKRIETRIYKKILEESREDDLKKLGLSLNTRQLAIDCLDASVKSNPLFIRFLAYSQLSPKPFHGAPPAAPMGQDGMPHRFAELFPHETKFIAKKFGEIIKSDEQWKGEHGAEEFKEYVTILEKYFSGTDIGEALEVDGEISEVEKKIKNAYSKVISSDFPIIIPPPLGGYYKPPYFDPELRVSIRTPESIAEEKRFLPLQKSLADKLGLLGVGQFANDMRAKPIRSVISIGEYGANLTFTAAAEADKEIVLFLNDQIRHFDRNLKKFFPLLEISEQAFGNISDQRIQEMSREDTMLHEFSHSVYHGDTEEAKKLGPEAESFIAEISAESIHRGLAKELIDSGEIEYTPEQYTVVTICMPLQVLERADPEDEYYKAAVFVLNGLFENGIAEFDGSHVAVKDHAAFFEYLKSNAKEIISLYKDPEMTQQKAKNWLSKKCKAGSRLQELIGYIKSKK